ncbi:MAG: hypothetical protein LBC56_05205 [Oscillospiraceae bacterium]|jgi:hypothetical protein|nr:hypothetical protein [Oscillospiraceae bacterium]
MSALKKFLIIFCALLIVFLTACQSLDIQASPEDLMRPPAVDPEQNEIERVLRENVGNVRLKYPKRGNYRSAFITYDVDGDGQNEAIVFFASDIQDSRVRICILDKPNGEWELMQHLGGEGTEVQEVNFQKFTDDYVNIVVGYESGDQLALNDTIVVYSYRNDSPANAPYLRDIYREEYKQIITLRRQERNYDELLVLNNSWVTDSDGAGMRSAAAVLVRYDEQEKALGKVSECNLSASSVDDSKIYIQELDKDNFLAYIDHVVDKNSIFTESLVIKENSVRKAIRPESSQRDDFFYTKRSAAFPTSDIDGDGKYEVPFTPDKSAAEIITDPLSRISDGWLVYVLWQELFWDDSVANKYVPKYRTVYNEPGQYFFIIPDGWLDFVSVRTSREGREMIFSTKNTRSNSKDLLSVFAMEKGNETVSVVPEGMELIAGTDGFDYYADALATYPVEHTMESTGKVIKLDVVSVPEARELLMPKSKITGP